MMHPAYTAGKLAALAKLGMDLEFDSPEQLQQYNQAHSTIKNIGGTVGSIGGGLGGGALGSVAGTAAGGPVGGFAGGLAGGEVGGRIGEKVLGGTAGLLHDIHHDVNQRTTKGYNTTMGTLNQAGGMPTGARV
jgi:hypothetical protein